MSEASYKPGQGGLKPVATLAMIVAALALLGMVAIEGWQVIARYVLNDSPGWTEPLAILCMNTTMMFGAAVGVRNDAHFGFFIAVQATRGGVRRMLLGIACAVAAAIGAMLSWWGGELMIDGWDVAMAGTTLPQGLSFTPICVGGALIALFALERIALLFRPVAGEA